MVDPVQAHGIALAALAGGGVVGFGVMYAVFYALARMNCGRSARNSPRARLFRPLSWVMFVALLLCVVALAWQLNLHGYWLLLVTLMVAGYFFAPRFIWQLSIEVHSSERDTGAANEPAAEMIDLGKLR